MTDAAPDAARTFGTAQALHGAALRQFAAGDVRDAAELAWRATRTATAALVIARTGEPPARERDTGRAMRMLLRGVEPEATSLRQRYYERQGILAEQCSYLGFCDPVEDVEELIRATPAYIDDARRLAGV